MLNSYNTEIFRILPNHYEGKDTYILGNYVQNGCQLFHIDKLDDIREMLYEIPKEMEDEVRSICNELRVGTEEEYKEIFYSDSKFRSLFFKNGLFVNQAVFNEELIHVANSGKRLDELITHEDALVRSAVADQGYGLDILINDENWIVRKHVALQGYGLEILINDESWIVRRTLANQGYGLDVLVNDKSSIVRETVASQGYGLDILINDKDWNVRSEVAKQGYGLETLINDETSCVRNEVAKHGYGLAILINDEDYYVKDTAMKAVINMKKEIFTYRKNEHMHKEECNFIDGKNYIIRNSVNSLTMGYFCVVDEDGKPISFRRDL